MSLSRFMHLPLILILAATPLLPQEPAHVVTPADMQKALRNAVQSREANREELAKFFSSEPVKKTLKTAGIDSAKVVKAVAMLEDEELERLAAQAGNTQRDISAGALSNQELTYAVIALGTAVLILVIVAA